MASEFRLQVVHVPSGTVVASWPPGLSEERDVVDDLCARVAVKGVGVGTTTAHVIGDVRAAATELFYDLKSLV